MRAIAAGPLSPEKPPAPVPTTVEIVAACALAPAASVSAARSVSVAILVTVLGRVPGARRYVEESRSYMHAPTFDLQSHSIHSDGALAPAQVVALAAAAGVELLALSDHDTVDGVPEAARAASEHGLRLS